MRYVIREKFVRLGEDSNITNEAGQPVFQVDGKVFSLHHTLVMRDLAGNEVATVRKHLLALTPTFEITRAGQELAEVRKKLFTPFVDRFIVDIPGPDDLAVTGSIFEHTYTISRRGAVVATVDKAWISLTETYGVDIATGEDEVLLLATVLTLDLVEDAEHAH